MIEWPRASRYEEVGQGVIDDGSPEGASGHVERNCCDAKCSYGEAPIPSVIMDQYKEERGKNNGPLVRKAIAETSVKKGSVDDFFCDGCKNDC